MFFIFKRHPNCVSLRPTTSDLKQGFQAVCFGIFVCILLIHEFLPEMKMTHPTNRSPLSPPPQAPYDCLVQVRDRAFCTQPRLAPEPLFLPPHAVPSHTHTKGISRNFDLLQKHRRLIVLWVFLEKGERTLL